MKILTAMTEITQKLMEIEKTSFKRVVIEYSGGVGVFSFYVVKNRLAYTTWVSDRFTMSTTDPDPAYITRKFEVALKMIAEISAIPDGPVEEMVQVTIPVSRAAELGLVKS